MQEEHVGLEKMLNNITVAATTNLNELIRFNVETLCRCFALESSRNSIANRPVCATAGLSTLPHAAHVCFLKTSKVKICWLSPRAKYTVRQKRNHFLLCASL